MTDETVYESTVTRPPAAVGSYLHGIADALVSGDGIPVDGAGSVVVEAPADRDLAFEVEVEREADTTSIEFELEWDEDSASVTGPEGSVEPASEGGDADAPAGDSDDGPAPEDADQPAGEGADVATDDAPATGERSETVPVAGSDATFELYRDNAGEWRWRLRHANGNVIADSGEGYTRKAGARNGIESVKRNAAGALVDEQE